MVDAEETAAILQRALSYPYEAPRRSYLYRSGTAAELPAAGFDAGARAALLCYGANAAPEALRRKLASLPEAELPVIRGELEGFDVVYSAHVSPYGAVPGTLRRRGGTTAPVFVAYPDEEQLRLLSLSEPNYELRTLSGLRCRLEDGRLVAEAGAFVSRHGCLLLEGTEVALAAVRSRGRTLPELGQAEVLERVRAMLAPELPLPRFVELGLDPEAAAARTAALRAGAGRAL